MKFKKRSRNLKIAHLRFKCKRVKCPYLVNYLFPISYNVGHQSCYNLVTMKNYKRGSIVVWVILVVIVIAGIVFYAIKSKQSQSLEILTTKTVPVSMVTPNRETSFDSGVYFDLSAPIQKDVLAVSKPFIIRWTVKGRTSNQPITFNIYNFHIENGNRDAGHVIASGVTQAQASCDSTTFMCSYSWKPTQSFPLNQIGIQQGTSDIKTNSLPTTFSGVFSVK